MERLLEETAAAHQELEMGKKIQDIGDICVSYVFKKNNRRNHTQRNSSTHNADC